MEESEINSVDEDNSKSLLGYLNTKHTFVCVRWDDLYRSCLYTKWWTPPLSVKNTILNVNTLNS